jgi:cycloeucalenol cycloisomerase
MWLSPDPARRWMERFVLFYSPVWMAVMGVVQATRAFTRWGDAGHLALGVGLALPLWLVPLVAAPPVERAQPLFARHSTRFNLFVTSFSLLQNYFGSPLFFDRLGMEYHFSVHWILARVPIFLYFVTIAYFATYYVVLAILLRRLRALALPTVARAAARLALCFGVAFAETAAMANDSLREYFKYRDRGFMLTWGSLCYATVFLLSLPVAERLDDEPRTLRRVLWQTLAANMAVMLCYEVYSWLIVAR